MTTRGKVWMCTLWPGIWGAIMLASGAMQMIFQLTRVDAPWEWTWMRIWAASYLGLGPLIVLAAVRLHQGRRWPRLPLQAFLALFVAGILAFVIWWQTHVWTMFRESGASSPPLIVRNVAHIVMAIGGFCVCAVFAGGAVLALHCLRSEDVRSHASQSGF